MNKKNPENMPTESSAPLSIFAWARRVLFGSSGSLLETIDSHENNYNIIRVILAASVIWFHSSYIAGTNRPDWASRHFYPVTDLGGLAVQCFFFLSGLFVAQSIHKDGSLLDFSIKRVMRIFPGLFACLVVTTILLSVATHGLVLWHVLVLPETYDYILNNSVLNLKWSIPNLIPENPSSTINGSIHTLNTEVKMYVMLWLLALAGVASKKNSITIASILILISIGVTGNSITAVISAPTDAYSMITMFVVGVLTFSIADKIAVSLIQGILLTLLLSLTRKTPQIHVLVFYALAVWLMMFFGQLSLLRRWFKPKVDPSYGIYIYGWPCEQFVKVLIPSSTATAVTFLAIPVAYFFAVFSWHYVEKPCMDMAKSIARKRSSIKDIFTPFKAENPWAANFYALVSILALCLVMQFLTSQFSFLPARRMEARIIDFGPQKADVKDGFNVQPDGRSALWVKVSTTPSKNTVIVFDGHSLETTVDQASMILTAGVPKSMLQVGGSKQIYLRDVSRDGVLRSQSVVLQLNR